MDDRLLYLDSSAIVKLAVEEPESRALALLITAWPHRVSSQLTLLEVSRAIRRYSPDAAYRARCERTLDPVALVPLDAAIIAAATELEPAELRSPVAIHLASALSLGDQLGAAVVYDRRLAQAFDDAGTRVLQPGR